MIEETYDLLILGGGPAGVTAALRARELGATVAIVDKGPLGGACTNDGCVPTRFLAHTARLIRNSAEFADYGLKGEAPVADVAKIMEKARAMVSRIHAKKAIREHLIEVGAAVHEHAGAASFVDPHTITFGGGWTLRGNKILLCIGGHARRLSIPGGELALTHSDVWHMECLPERLLVIGGAATGCQLASVFAAFGSRVTLMDTAPRIVPGEDPDVSAELLQSFKARGIEVVLGASMTGIKSTPAGARIAQYTVDGATVEDEFDAVIAAVGWPGNIEGINLDAAGVETARGYVVVDGTLRTTAPHIYAAGDITGRMMLVQSAGEEGLAAVENALMEETRAYSHQVVPHGGFTNPEYGSVGLTEPQAQAESHVISASVPFSHLDRAIIDGRPTGFCKLIVDRQSRRIVGAHVVGQQAVEIVQVAATAMQSHVPIDDLARLEYAYPTFTSAIGLAARRVLRKLGETSTVRHWGSADAISAPEWESGA